MPGDCGLDFGRNLCMFRNFFDRSVISSLFRVEVSFVPTELDEQNYMGSVGYTLRMDGARGFRRRLYGDRLRGPCASLYVQIVLCPAPGSHRRIVRITGR